MSEDFDHAQKQWLQGFVSGIEARKAADKLASRTQGEPSGQPIGPDALQHAAQDRAVSAGGKLVAEETAKRTRHPLDRWDELVRRAEAGQFPKGTDVFLTKYHGLFYVAPAENSFMCRLRIPNGILNAWQMRGLADAADAFGGGYADVTTRANLQIREIPAAHAVDLLLAVQDLGLTARGAGDLLAAFGPLTQKHACSLSQLVLAWTVAQPGVTHALAGCRTAQQAKENARGGEITLDAKDLAEMERLITGLGTPA